MAKKTLSEYQKIQNLGFIQIQRLRDQISLNSLYISDYENTYNIDPHAVCDYFDGFMEYLTELEIEKYGKELDDIWAFFDEFDTKENLIEYHNRYKYYEL